jgi:hypothetical protein
MFQRWRPAGPGEISVLRADQFPSPTSLRNALLRLLRKYGNGHPGSR